MLSTTVGDSVRSYQTALQQALGQISADIMSQIALEILAAYDRDGRTFVFGNGGSAATASHMACDLSKNIVTDGIPHLRCVSLTDNTPLLTALANDRGYEAIFAEQLRQAHVQANDLIIAISGSGNSPNVLAGVSVAAAAGARMVGMTGFRGGQLAPLVDVALVVPSTCMEIVEDVHLMISHAVTTTVRTALRDRELVPA